MYTVRTATVQDARELARLRWESRLEEQPRQKRGAFIDACEAWLVETLNDANWVVAVAESEDGSLGGCMYLQRVAKVPVPGQIQRAWGYITNAYVSPGLRGLGIGRQLLEVLCVAGRERNLEFLTLWPSTEAVSFYRRAGFLPVSEHYSGNHDEPPMEKIL